MTMPTYEYRCNACKRKITLNYKTYADYDAASPACSHCGSTELTRLISRVAIRRSVASRLLSGGWDDDSGDDSALDELENADPRTLGRVLREMSAEVGEDMGPEFDEVMGRLEHGENPEDIEASMPDLPDNPLTGGGLSPGLDDLSD
jgi:putative FmdB family regulatory protein